MALTDWFSLRSPLDLEGDDVRLRPFHWSDYPEWAELRAASRAFLQPWEPTWPVDDLTRAGFRRRMSAYQRDADLGVGYAFLVFRQSDGAMTGGISLSNVRRGVALTATVGYWSGAGFVRQGHTLGAVRVASRFAFEKMRLHRLEAACVPDNEPSKNLLLKAGFRQEGLACAYLKINGKWRDHLLFGLVAPDAGRDIS